MNMKQTFTLLICLCLTINGHAQLDKLLDKAKQATTGTSLSNDEIVKGLKEALSTGISKGADLVSQTDGYFKNPEIKIPFPAEAKLVETKLRALGMGSEVDKFVLALNRGAEDAAKEAKPIFLTAIKQMTIQDALGVLNGGDNAATQYLQKTTTIQLKDKFKPIVQNSLNKVNATKYYGNLVTEYNKVPFVTKVNPDLNAYATDMAIKGLFTMIAKEEKNIRQDPAARTTDLLKKVFSTQK